MENNNLKTVSETIKNWWVSLIIGVMSIVLGLIFLFQPFDGWITLVTLFVISFFITGIFEVFFAASNRKSLRGWGWILTAGIISILIGVFMLCIPAVTPVLMVYFLGLWVMLQSVWAVGISMELRRAGVKGWGWLMVLAILGIILSFIFIIAPATASRLIVAMAVASFLVYGIFWIYLAIQLKSFKNKLEK